MEREEDRQSHIMPATDELPPKPQGSTWTDEQWHAVVAGGSDILVAAAAGSGKTAVLVERIIRKISADTDVDRLLVATFTKAAAAEMKERIRLALERALERQPQSEHLRRQLAMMNRASITTLHSFCLDVIRRYYPMIGLDPGFRVANETEAELMRLDVLDTLFEERYAAADVDLGFLRLADDYGGERGDEPLYHLVQELYDFSRSNPWPEHWLLETAAAFEAPDVEALGNSEWVKALTTDVELVLRGAKDMLEDAIRVIGQPGGPEGYLPTLQEDLKLVERLAEAVHAGAWSSWYDEFRTAAFGKLKALRGQEIDKLLQEQVKSLRDQVKKLIGELVSDLFSRPPEHFLEELHEAAPQMKALATLVIDFGVRYEKAKRGKGLLDFGDLEHYCLRILRSPASTPEMSLPSAAALEYRRQFDEILLDEYQDTNRVQEAIVQLIAREEPGNRFMVGDVKQSIYRFRLAEPGLFLAKYKAYAAPSQPMGLRIDLARNFRSRAQVVDGVNDVFRAIMRETVAEMDYDRAAELVSGASYPPAGEQGGPYRVELAVLDRAEAEKAIDASEGETEDLDAVEDLSDLQTAQLEARYIAAQIGRLREGEEGEPPFRVYDGKRQTSRALAWRDIVILLRATSQWAPIIIEELQAQGIPAYAELSTGYFDATEVEIMLSLLRIIDNPYQDIPLAGVLRSPLFGLDAEELAAIRVQARKGSYYDAVRQAASNVLLSESVRSKLSLFLERLELWREEARQGSLAELVWQIYRKTGYYDFVGGLPGGLQRQANLRALHDRARQYEETSFRGLFRFLRFIDRMRERGGDLGTARALGEQEDVVRIMSIHRSKGLEFPVVFTAGLGKQFNMQDLNRPFLMHKDLGYGPRHVDSEVRVSYPTLPQLAIRRKQRMELLAEEMRILYVAMTRPKEKLFLVGTLADAGKQLARWQDTGPAAVIPDFSLAAARRFMDWLLPLVGELPARQLTVAEGGQGWTCALVPAAIYAAYAAATEEVDPEDTVRRQEVLEALTSGVFLAEGEEEWTKDIDQRLSWRYPHQAATALAAKTSVTEMKRLQAEWGHAEGAVTLDEARGDGLPGSSGAKPGALPPGALKLRRPRFMEERALTAAERGTVSHLVMQHIPLTSAVTIASLEVLLTEMQERRLLTAEQAAAVDLAAIVSYFDSPIGVRMLQADWVRREVPFSCTLPASRIYPQAAIDPAAAEEPVLIQGVIDCLFEDDQGLVLVDYKTDRIVMNQWEAAAERHRFQLELYAEAVGAILKKPVAECHVFFFDGGQSVRLSANNHS
ncbi:helicase-exonuclease AddAB subunit AddA [Paenibacillus daejeonensis]|uniref:helicase-exonuclease AddAB subunit AddA n=1 Tax=Paenibacillus daejeonensis TaxID=135193 RepID=UPI000367CFD8|nr:helicase-exonuclease AddAB subunit AddA [Paenibacillus daejeonensis]